jgi:cyclic pyranopterin phosphate synthase
MTTNGFLFPKRARALRDAGLHRLSFSLDSLDRDNFKKITGRDGLNEVLESIALAQELGFSPVKVNAVIIRDINDHEIEGLAEFARERNLSLRFIEFMPLDSARAWQKEMVVTGREIIERLHSHFSTKCSSRREEALISDLKSEVCSAPSFLRLVSSDNPSSTSKRWTFADGKGEIGIIAPVSEPFCGHCNRIRLTADGKIRTCLFSVTEHDLRPLLRDGASDDDIAAWLGAVALQKEARHHIGEPEFVPPPRSMSCIGG